MPRAPATSDPKSPDASASAPDSTRVNPFAAGGREVFVSQFQLKVVEGPEKGAAFVSRSERTVLGTHKSNDVVLTDSTVSRFHCEITLEAGLVLIRDLESLNRTSVNGVTVRVAELSEGATIVVGSTRLRFTTREEAVRIEVSDKAAFGVMVGRSTSMRQAFALLERAAASDATVLLGGETGTGKEAASESIHRESKRRDGPFIALDCGAIPPDLLESELFGHERGAFTGAQAAREGMFEAANHGTILLDEIGELSADLQPKLLRVLEKREVKRVGGNKVIPVDVRVIAATNRDLRAEVNAKRFRSDLYYRLAVLQIRLPPLRERAEDFPLLIEHLLQATGSADRPEAAVVRSPGFLAAAQAHVWPGNVRELRNYVERCLAMHQEVPIDADAGPAGAGTMAEVDLSVPLGVAREKVTRDFERRYLEAILTANEGNVSAAARAAKVDRIHFHRLLRRYGLR